MTHRRRDKRFKFDQPVDGALRIFPGIVMQHRSADEWIGISRHPAETGEILLLDVMPFDEAEGEVHHGIRVCVVESRPVIVDGDMRHRIRLHGGITASVQFEREVRRG